MNGKDGFKMHEEMEKRKRERREEEDEEEEDPFGCQ